MQQTQTKSSRTEIRVALAGNPNSGKTTIFNNLTGFRQRVANYPGVTVEIQEGDFDHDGTRFRVIDLPGTYSLSPYSAEEMVARNHILEQRPDVVVDVIDASNIERNLYLATQFMELGVNLVLALNMADMARTRGIEFDLEKLSELLGVRIVPTVGHRKEGMKELLEAVREAATEPQKLRRVAVNYGVDIEEQLEKLLRLLARKDDLCRRYGARWLAVKLLERDREVLKKVKDQQISDTAAEASARIESLYGDSAEIILADRRYGFISGACQEAVRTTVEARHTMSDRIDDVLTSGAMGLPILLAMMYGVFYLTFRLGNLPMRWIESFFELLGGWVGSLWQPESESLLKSLLQDGVIGGVGSVLAFLPYILLLFLGITILEDTGYMARAAFIMDNLMHRIGLHGKSFIPLLIGFGCSVPGIMATRILENRRDRLTTILILPLMSCGARLTIYTLIIPAFFPSAWQVPVLWMIYLTGIILAVLAAKLLRRTLLKGSSMPFVMELPPYRLPMARSVLLHLWDRGWLFLRTAGTLILAVSILLWALSSFPVKKEYERDYQAERAQAERTYSRGLAEVAASLDLQPAGAALLGNILQGAAPQAAGTVAGRDARAVEGFVRMLSEVERARRHLGMKGLDRPASAAMNAELAALMAGMGEEQRNYYAASVFYLDRVRAPCNKRMAEIDKMMGAEKLGYSLTGRLGRALATVLRPLGFDWRISTALIGAFAAKEAFVAQLGVLYSVEEAEVGAETLRVKLQRDYSGLVAVCIMLFCLIGTPCMATMAMTRRESGAWSWVLLQWVGLTATAYLLTLAVYQTGLLLGLGG
ncbi:MAG: ferrous iron transport protein B [Candidatus Glassbacteria bacterium]|nr:ferrous iron transport protein B [Candidatus Glassbacteria bacterium]